MRKIREVLRLKLDLKLSDHQVGQSVGLARSTVQDYVIRAKQAGLTWPLPPDLDDHQLEQQLFNKSFQAGKKLDENEGPRGRGLKFPGLMGLSAK